MSAFENQVVLHNYGGLKRKVGKNFTRFVDFVLKKGESSKCLSSMQRCNLDVHWRPLIGR